ncbi:PREDICTED: uncharacterized protein LOC105854411, partial [Condylura cristata]|uniref:uncharacterized protein LOC105854411 n=1 Tax=Condylura cristata TaxID=143302 RepID=UPI000643BC46
MPLPAGQAGGRQPPLLFHREGVPTPHPRVLGPPSCSPRGVGGRVPLSDLMSSLQDWASAQMGPVSSAVTQLHFLRARGVRTGGQRRLPQAAPSGFPGTGRKRWACRPHPHTPPSSGPPPGWGSAWLGALADGQREAAPQLSPQAQTLRVDPAMARARPPAFVLDMPKTPEEQGLQEPSPQDESELHASFHQLIREQSQRVAEERLELHA